MKILCINKPTYKLNVKYVNHKVIVKKVSYCLLKKYKYVYEVLEINQEEIL